MTRSKMTVGAVLARLILFAAAWVVIAGTDPSAWVIGAPTVMAATWASLRLRPQTGAVLSPVRILLFVPYFLWYSLKGAVDVAQRVMRPRMRIAPGLRAYRLRLVSPSARVLLLDVVSLLPGTLSADLRGDQLSLHALDARDDAALDAEVDQLERRIGALFGERIAPAVRDTDTPDGVQPHEPA